MAAEKKEGAAEAGEKKKGRLFTKEQLMSSGKFAGRRDLLGALLKDGQQYSVMEVEKMAEKFMKGKEK